MNQDQLRSAIETHVAPVLRARVAQGTIPSTTRETKVVAYLAPHRLGLKPSSADTYRLVLERDQSFTQEERLLAEDFVKELLAIHLIEAGPYEGDLLAGLPVRAIARHLGAGPAAAEVLRQYDKWAAQTNEGQPIAASIGIDPSCGTGDTSLEELFAQKFSAVLTNGFDTLLVSSPDGQVCSFEQLESSEPPPFAPYRLRHIAAWAQEGRISMVLNRLGEQLIFRQQILKFAKRGGRWSYYPHDASITRISPPGNQTLRRAIYASCLDVSFARCGGCIGVRRSATNRSIDEFVAAKDLLNIPPTNIKARAMQTMITGPFQTLDRRLRQELLAHDGAVVLTHTGQVVAVGAIVDVPSGSDGGGRRAAAMRLSQLGLGIKVSEDGAIIGFADGTETFRT